MRRRPPPPPPRRRPGGLRFDERPFLLTALQQTLERIPAPALLRPDLGTLRGRALLAAVEKLETEGVLVASGGALIARRSLTVCGRVIYESGIVWADVAEPLRVAGLPLRSGGTPLCE